jgi:hypothetical protein
VNTSLIKMVLTESNVVWFQIGAFLAFILLFLGVVFWICLPGAKDYYDRIAVDLLKGEGRE